MQKDCVNRYVLPTYILIFKCQNLKVSYSQNLELITCAAHMQYYHVCSISYCMERCILDAVSVIHDFGQEPGGVLFQENFRGFPILKLYVTILKKFSISVGGSNRGIGNTSSPNPNHVWCRCKHLVSLPENDIKRAGFSRISNSFLKPIKHYMFERRKMKDRSRILKTLIFLSIIYDTLSFSTIGKQQ